MNSKKIGYGLIEPNFDESFYENNLDQLVAYLDIICKELPNILLELPKSTKYKVIAAGSPYCSCYPAIGFYCENPDDLNLVTDSYDFEEVVDNWLSKDKIEEIKLQSKSYKTKSWLDIKKE
jgi:hypothetical protein